MRAATRGAAARVARGLGALTLGLAGLMVAAPAYAAGQVTVSGTPDPSAPTQIVVKGSGYQVVQGGFGGVYVLFGTVSGAWQPSKGGKSGSNYKYVPDSATKDNAGYQAFVAFPGSSTASESEATLSADGSFTVTLTVPGAVITTNGGQVDCTKVQCGVFTIGAHGVVNANNEAFTPVTFKSAGSSGSSGASTPAGQSGSSSSTSSQPSSKSTAKAGSSSGTGSTGTSGSTVPGTTAGSSPSTPPDAGGTGVTALDGVPPAGAATDATTVLGESVEAASASTSGASSGGNGPLLAAAGAAVVLLAGGGGTLWWRLRRKATS